MFKKLRFLWSKTPVDCRFGLVMDFIFSPDDFHTRYLNEMAFQTDMYDRWENK